MMTRCMGSAWLLLSLSGAVAPDAIAQEAPSGWAWGASGTLMFWTQESDPFDRLGGPGAQVSLLRPRSVGFAFRATYLVDTGFYGLSGMHGDLTLAYGLPAGQHLVQLKAGGHGMLAGDSDGTIWAGGGPVAGAGVVLRLAGRLGLQVDGVGRLFVNSGRAIFAPGGSVALVLLPR